MSELFDGIHSKTYGAALIPIHKKAAFISEIRISARIELEKTDLAEIQKLAKLHKLEVDISSISTPFDVIRAYRFEDSLLKSTNNVWSFKLKTKRTKTSQFKDYCRPKNKDEPDL